MLFEGENSFMVQRGVVRVGAFTIVLVVEVFGVRFRNWLVFS